MGDFNRLDTSFLEHDFGLTQCVQDITHGQSILDKFFAAIHLSTELQLLTAALKVSIAIFATGCLVPCSMQPTSRKKFCLS